MPNAAREGSIDRVNDALLELDEFNGSYPKDALDLLLQNREEAVPHLIRALEYLCEDPERCLTEDPRWQRYVFSAFLLGYFRENRAHDPLIKLFSLPGGYVDSLFGEVITEDLPALLYRTSNGSLDSIKQLALKKDVGEYIRGAAIEALALAVYDVQLDREDLLDYFASLFKRKDLAEEHSFFWSSIAFSMCDLYPLGYIDIVEQAYKDRLIEPDSVGLGSFKRVLDKGKAKALSKFPEILHRRDLDLDFHRNISSWACYRDEDEFSDNMLLGSKSYKNREKRKRKAVKNSKRKNRKQK